MRKDKIDRHGAPQQDFQATCEKCGKRSFVTRKAAKAAAKAISPNAGANAYKCPVPGAEVWHWGHKTKSGNPDPDHLLFRKFD